MLSVIFGVILTLLIYKNFKVVIGPYLFYLQYRKILAKTNYKVFDQGFMPFLNKGLINLFFEFKKYGDTQYSYKKKFP